MKTFSTLLKRSLQVHIALMSLVYFPCFVFAIEPIGTIGQPFPEQHAFLPDGNILRAVLSHIQIIDTDTGAVIDEFGERTYVSDVVFSPTAEHLAILNFSSDSKITTINIWDIIVREQVSEWEIPARIEVATFSPIGSLFTVSFNDEIHLWNWEIGAFRGKMIGQRRPWEQCHFSSGGRTCSFFPRDHASVFTPDGRSLIVASARPDLELWNVTTRRLEGHFEGHTGTWVEDAVISPDGTRLATYEKDWNDVYVWDVDTQQLLWQEESGISRISDVVFRPDNRHLYVAAQTGTMQLLVSAERGLFRESAISPDGQKLAIGLDPWIEVRDLQTGKVETQFSYSSGYSDIAFSSTGRWVAARGFKSIFLFDLENPEKPQRPTTKGGPDIDISSLFTFSENDEYLAASTRTDDNKDWVLLWKREGDTFVFQYAWQVPELSSQSRLAFGSDTDDSLLLAVPRTQETQIWRLLPDGPQLLKTVRAGFPAHFTPEGRYLFASQDRYLQIWDWKTETLIEHSPIPDHLVLSRDGTILLSYADTGQIQIWDAKALLPSKTVVTPHGKQIVTLGEVKRNQLLQNFPNPFNPETWIPFRLAAENHVTIHIHNATGQLVRRLSPGTIPAGDYSSQAQAVYWDGRNQVGEPVSSGVYLYTIYAGDFSATRKLLIQK